MKLDSTSIEAVLAEHYDVAPSSDVAASIADFSGSTSGILEYVADEKPTKAMLITECSTASNIADNLPEVDFVGPCNLCPYMKKITLEKLLYVLHTMEGQVEVDANVAEKARKSVQAMINLSKKAGSLTSHQTHRHGSRCYRGGRDGRALHRAEAGTPTGGHDLARGSRDLPPRLGPV